MTQGKILTDSWIRKIKSLPSLSETPFRLQKLIQSPDADFKAIQSVLETDPALTSKVLKLANSSYYAIPGGATTVNKALSFLGLNTLAQLSLTASVFSAFPHVPHSPYFDLKSFITHSFAVGLAHEKIYSWVLRQHHPSAFTSGLLHDIGKLVWATVEPTQFAENLQDAHQSGLPLLIVESQKSLPTHIDLGVALCNHWNLPRSISEEIEQHHQDSALAFANLWVHQHGWGRSGGRIYDELQFRSLEKKFKITSEMSRKIALVIDQEIQKMGGIGDAKVA